MTFQSVYPIWSGATAGDVDWIDWNDSSLVGAPPVIGGNFWAYQRNITSLEGAPKVVGGYVNLRNNLLLSLKGIHLRFNEISGELYLEQNPIKSHVLGLLKIKGLKRVLMHGITYDSNITELIICNRIINRHLENGRDILRCQEELLDNDLGAYAQL